MNCKSCDEPIRSDNLLGYCQRNPVCKAKYWQAYGVKRGDSLRIAKREWMANRSNSIRFELWKSQEGLCAWPPCGKNLGKNPSRWAIDHNHRGGNFPRWDMPNGRNAIRGLVHMKCNTEIGALERLVIAGYITTNSEIRDYLQRGNHNVSH